MLSTAQIMEVLDEEDFWQNIRPKDDAIYYLKKLTEEQHEIYIVSATYYKSIPYKIKLIEEYFPFICTYKNIIFTRNKSMIIGDVLVDDGYHNLKTFTSGKRVLLRAPSNQYYNIKELEIDRFCIDWSEVYQYIQELNEVTN